MDDANSMEANTNSLSEVSADDNSQDSLKNGDPGQPVGGGGGGAGLSVEDEHVLLDYEAEEPEEEEGKIEDGAVKTLSKESESETGEQKQDEAQATTKEEKEEGEDVDDTKESGEELEEGELSDEDEETRKERLKPQPVCRFYSKGQCTWGSSCRFVHPGVLDKGNYNMFAPPRPILPGGKTAEDTITENVEVSTTAKAGASSETREEVANVSPVIRKPETAWERGLRQAKEMKRLSQQRRETDIEYEEKRTTMSLTQAELDRENDYYTRPASPLHDNDDFMDEPDDLPIPNQDGISRPGFRRVAPPPPADFDSRPVRRYPPLNSPPRGGPPRYGGPPPHGRLMRGRYPSEGSPPPPQRIRRVAPPRSPSYQDHGGGPRHRRGDEWEDPWMRSSEGGGGERKGRGGRRGGSRKRSYSSGSSRSSSRSSSSRSRSRSPRSKRRRNSSGRRGGRSSSDSSSSRSRSRSSTPEGIPRRNANNRRSESPRNTGAAGNAAPLQKRLMNLASSSSTLRNIKKEPADRPARGGFGRDRDRGDRDQRSPVTYTSAADAALAGSSSGRPRRRSSSGPRRRRSSPSSRSRSRSRSSRSSSSSSSRSSRSRSPSSRRRNMMNRKRRQSSENERRRMTTKPAVPREVPIRKPNPESSKEVNVAATPATPPPPAEEEAAAPPKPQIRMTFKSSATVSKNKTVLEKLGADVEAKKASPGKKKVVEEAPSSTTFFSKAAEPPPVLTEPAPTSSQKSSDAPQAASGSNEKKKDKKTKKSVADRHDELLRQLKAVEKAIAKKRTKISR